VAIEPPHIPGLTDWRPLARGGFAVVWEARQETLDRLVAVKVDQRRLDVESERLRFLREAGAAGRMSGHPGIVTVHDAGILADDRPYLVMELCPGGSLTSYLEAGARPTEQRVRAVGVRIADALAATHARGVLHRDVKPANILIDAYDQVGLADFGLAALPGPGLASQETFQALTPAYTAPEILRRQPPTQYSDVYSLAATLYALLSGRAPRWPEGGTPTLVEVLKQQQRPLQPVPDVNPALMQVLEQALSLDPRKRPTAAAFRDQLRALDLPEKEDPAGPSEVAVQADTGARRLPRATVSAPRAIAGAAAGNRSTAAERTPGVAAGTAGAGRRRSVLVSLVGLALLAVLVTALVLANRGPVVASPAPASAPPATSAAGTPTEGATTPAESPSPSAAESSSPTASAGPGAVPDGFDDCSDQLGDGSYCPTKAECWAGVISVFDLPSLGTAQKCGTTHVYQTFAAGLLEEDVRRQSQLEDSARVKRLCSSDSLDKLLDDRERQTNWEVLALPPQEADGSDRIFRCLFGRGERTGVVELPGTR
jgi:hypothetical protein